MINGPNLNRLGKREPEIYGTTTLAEIEAMCREAAGDTPVRFHQSNSEGQIIDWIHEAIDEGAGHRHQPGGLLVHVDRDPRRAENVLRPDRRAPHLEHPQARGDYHHSYVSKVATAVIAGLGPRGYAVAVRAIGDLLAAASKVPGP